MVRLNIIVEGQTEETFVRDLLAPHLGQLGVFATARCVETGRRKQHIHRGGLIRYDKARKDIVTWLRQDKSACVSTLFDYYALPEDFPGNAAPRGALPALERASRLEQALAADISDSRFIPYIQVHEFEALLFTDVEKTGVALGAAEAQLRTLREIRAAFETPEHINDSEETAPSKRLLRLLPGYRKTLHGPLAVERIGLESLRQACPKFATWLRQLEGLVGGVTQGAPP